MRYLLALLSTLTLAGCTSEMPTSVPTTQLASGVCLTSTAGTYKNLPFVAQTDTFTVTWDVTPSQAGMTGYMALSNGPALGSAGYITWVRFNASNFIDAKNGATWTPASGGVPYVAGTLYHFRLTVNIPTQKFTVYVHSTGAEQVVASNLSFTTPASTLSNLAFRASPGSLTACDPLVVAVASVTETPASAALDTVASQQFASSVTWNDGNTYPYTITWTATGGTVTANGLYTAGRSNGAYSVIAAYGGKADTSAITITAVPSTCLAGGATLTLSGAQPQYDSRTTAVPNMRIDARLGTWSRNDYSIVAGKASAPMSPNLCWSGGTATNPLNFNTTPWLTWHSTGALLLYAPTSVVEDVRLNNYGDGLRLEDSAYSAVLRRVKFTDMHDDCLEDDRQHNVRVEDSFFNGCFVLISSRPGGAINPATDGQANTVTVDGSLLWQKPMPTCGETGQTPPCTGPTWKWDNRPGKPGPHLALINTVVRIDQAPSNGVINLPPNTTCVNTTIVWRGAGAYPGPAVPAGCTVTTDIAVWDAAVADWNARHP